MDVAQEIWVPINGYDVDSQTILDISPSIWVASISTGDRGKVS